MVGRYSLIYLLQSFRELILRDFIYELLCLRRNLQR